MEIKLGNFELIYSTSVIQIGDLPIEIRLPDEIEGDYFLTFRFVKDEISKATITRPNLIDKFHLNIEFVNFYGPQNIWNTNLLELGTLRKYPLFLNYVVSTLLGPSKTILFNFYIKKEV